MQVRVDDASRRLPRTLYGAGASRYIWPTALRRNRSGSRLPDAFHQVRDAIMGASSVAVLTGAGLSAERRVQPVGDDPGASWESLHPAELASCETFRRDPELVWRWYLFRRERLSGRKTNAALPALSTLARQVEWFTLITQNVDGLFDHTPELRPLELHGNLWRTRCVSCGRLRRDQRTSFEALPPVCAHCGGILRPDVVWFGESLDTEILERATRAACVADVFLAVGTNGEPAPSLCGYARENGALVVSIDASDTGAGAVSDLVLPGNAEEALPKLAELFAVPATN